MKSLLILILILILACSGIKIEDSNYIAKVNNHSISFEEFIKRAEYTIRPHFCNGNSYQDKQIILNNLILEKLISDSLKRVSTELSKNEKNFVNGRINQAMRQKLYENIVTNQFKIDSSKILSNINIMGREYELSYIQLPGSNDKINDMFKFWETDSILNNKFPDINIFSKQLKWNEYEKIEILDSLYRPEISKNQIVGPFPIGKFSMYIKVEGWIDRPSITDGENKFRFKRYSDFLNKMNRETIYLEFIKDLMKGKDIFFNKKNFTKLINYFGSKLKMNKDQIIDINKANNQIISMFENNPEFDNKDILFEMGDENWTLNSFFKLVKTHPLVFRQKRLKKKEFANQLKLAIGDLIRDYYLTLEAKLKKIEQDQFVISEQTLWTNYFYTQSFLKNKFPNAKSSNNWLENEIFQEEMDQIIFKNRKNILVNWLYLEKINLTEIPLHATYPNEAYPNVTAEILPITKSAIDSALINQNQFN